MIEIDNIKEQINNLTNEIEQDRIELYQVPVRFQEAIKNAVSIKESKLLELNEQVSKLKEIFKMERLNKIIPDFEKHINYFFETYNFEETDDSICFQSQLFIDYEDNKLVVWLAEEEENLVRRKVKREKLRIKFPDGNAIEEFKTTDSFAKSVIVIGVSRVEQLGIRVLRLPLIGRIKSEKYQQREVLPDVFLVTQISNEKKVEILEQISEKLKLNLSIELI